MLDYKMALELFEYNPETGIFTNRVDRGRRAAVGSETGSMEGQGYMNLKVNGIKYKSHRVAWLMYTGYWPSGNMDHINHIRDDNRIVNLRVVTPAENMKNQSQRVDNTSGHTGVWWDEALGKWRAYIRVNTKLKHLGLFDDMRIACNHRLMAEIINGFHDNHGRVGAMI